MLGLAAIGTLVVFALIVLGVIKAKEVISKQKTETQISEETDHE